jgi:hypothetical protein
VLAQAIGIDVDVFEDLEPAEAWLNEGEGPWTTDEMLLPR